MYPWYFTAISTASVTSGGHQPPVGGAGVLQPPDLLIHGGVLVQYFLIPLVADQADIVPHGAQPPVGVVLPVEEPVLGAGGHHAVGLVGALGDQIVDEHPDVPLIPPEHQRLPPQNLQRRVHPGHKALGGGLLIPGGAVELPRPVQALDFFALQGGQQLGGV